MQMCTCNSNRVHCVSSLCSHRTNTLLEKVASAVEQSAFYSALWGSILTSPAVRLPGVSFVLLHLNRKLSMEDQLYVIGSDIELMVHDTTEQNKHPLTKITNDRIACTIWKILLLWLF